MNASPAAAQRPAPRLQVHGPLDAQRAPVEQFIRRVYRERYDADVRQFAPVLLSLRDADGEIVAAAGYRPADAGPLFLERYLGAPVDQLLARDQADSATRPARGSIVEVGHLAASRAGEGRRLITLLGPHLAAQGYQWVVSTLTEELRHLFVRLGIVPMALGVADPAVLGDQAAAWGSYYDHRPVVLAGHIEQALQRLVRRGATQ
ncbi:MAG: thermostable hemolysin [Rubrivivax sp.]|nr:thermostable hemolysin [Rubrivivax sp.]